MAPSAWSARFAPCKLWLSRNDDWTPPIVKTVASEGTGIAELLEAIEGYRAYLTQGDRAQHAAHRKLAWSGLPRCCATRSSSVCSPIT